MALDIDRPPVEGQEFSYEFQLWLTSFYQTLTEFMGASGLNLPNLSTKDRDALQNVQLGKLIYNTTDSEFQVFKAGTWRNVLTT